MLKGHAVTLTFKKRPKCSATRLNMIIIYVKNCKIRLQMTKLLVGHDFAARSCCDLDLQGSDPNVVRDTSSQYGDHFCEIFSKSDFKYPSYEPDTILLQGRPVTLKVGTQMLCATRRLNMEVISVK